MWPRHYFLFVVFTHTRKCNFFGWIKKPFIFCSIDIMRCGLKLVHHKGLLFTEGFAAYPHVTAAAMGSVLSLTGCRSPQPRVPGERFNLSLTGWRMAPPSRVPAYPSLMGGRRHQRGGLVDDGAGLNRRRNRRTRPTARWRR